ncbi:MAG: methyltransferase domain-containing protein [Ruminococcus sp.]|jgi:ubiquinone/menaquinone biosynthesis C-methylase UbiE|nr:methyltransferase domain-containing protein [Ruminococcus sp.]
MAAYAAYDSFAPCYDELIKASKDGVTQRYDRLLKVYAGNPRGKILLDIGCGTGQLSEHFSDLGFDVIGTDISEEMLNIAVSKRGGKPIEYLCQSATKLDLYGTVDIAIAARDTFNHLGNLGELEKAIKRTAFFMNPGGLLIFDWNTPYKHREKLAGKTFLYETPNVFCAWDNTSENGKIKMSLNLFKKEESGKYSRFETEIEEFTAETADVENILAQCGFEVKTYDFKSLKKPNAESEKIVFIGKKRG